MSDVGGARLSGMPKIILIGIVGDLAVGKDSVKIYHINLAVGNTDGNGGTQCLFPAVFDFIGQIKQFPVADD